ncbi:TPA: MATE family efflux transporter [bacterium]|nr:MATE family efflux transporter [bacterium]
MLRNRVDEFISNPKKALFILAGPTVVGMLVQVLYNLADTAYVGRLGAEAIAALTFSFPLFFILISINSGVGIGMGSRVSRLLGAKNLKEAENTAMHGLFISIAMAIIISILGIIAIKPLFRLFGASEEVLPIAISYMFTILIAIIFMFTSFIINSLFGAQGDTRTSTTIQITALIINIILDPIFIYPLGFGVQGAAIATCIAFACSLALGICFIRKKSYVKLRISAFSFSWETIRDIFSVGGTATLTMLLISIYMVFINKFMAHFGTEYVAAFGIVIRLESLATMPSMAVSFSLVTLVGMFYGAKRFDLLRGTIKYGMMVSVMFTVAIGIIFFIIPSIFLRIFTSDSNLLTLGSAYMRINVFTFPLMIISMVVSRSMQGMGFGFPGLIINFMRVILVAIPIAYIFVHVIGYGYLSIGVAAVAGGLSASIVGIIWLQSKLRKLDNEMRLQVEIEKAD